MSCFISGILSGQNACRRTLARFKPLADANLASVVGADYSDSSP